MITNSLKSPSINILSKDLPWIRHCLDWMAEDRPWSDETEGVADGIHVKKVAYETNSPTTCRFENHAREIDFQVIFEGGEVIEVACIGQVSPVTEYDEAGDVRFYQAVGANSFTLRLGAGDYAIFFPEDIHCCGGTLSGEKAVRKYVFKISRSHFDI